jgi:hypothetical protein
MQTELIPPSLAQLGTAVVILYLALQIVKVGREFAGKGPPTTGGDHSSRTEYRLNKLDEEMKERITRTEYESRQADLLRTVQRIESKLDRMAATRDLFKEDR